MNNPMLSPIGITYFYNRISPRNLDVISGSKSTKNLKFVWKNMTTHFQTDYSFNYMSCPCLVSWREYYVDTHPSLLQFSACRNIEYGGNVSGRVVKGGRYLMIIGQDESTYHQLTFSKNHWKAQNVWTLYYLSEKMTNWIRYNNIVTSFKRA